MSIFGFNVFLRRNTGFFLKHSASRFQSSVAYFTGFFYRVSVGWHLSDRVLSSFTELLFQVTELNLIYRVFFGCRSEISEKKKKKPRLGVIWVVHLLSQIFVSLLTVHFFLQPKHFVDIRFFLKKKIKKRWGRRARTADFNRNPPPPLKSPQKTFKLFFFSETEFFFAAAVVVVAVFDIADGSTRYWWPANSVRWPDSTFQLLPRVGLFFSFSIDIYFCCFIYLFTVVTVLLVDAFHRRHRRLKAANADFTDLKVGTFFVFFSS